MKNDKSLKIKIEKLANKSIFFDIKNTKDFHPIVLVDSVKSIISLDFNNPNNDLLNYLETLLPDSSVIDKKDSKIEIRNASFKELEEVLINKQKDKIGKVLTNFNMLSDGTQLVEFFLEMSLKQSGKSFIHIWRSFKIFKFAKIDDKLSFYRLMSTFIFNDNFRNDISFNEEDGNNIKKINDNCDDIIFYANLIDCMNVDFIRGDYIKNTLKSMISYFNSCVDSKEFIEVSYDKKKKNRADVLRLINGKGVPINYNNILLLDSARILIKNNQYISVSFLNSIYKKII